MSLKVCAKARKGFPGGDGGGVTPVPISNTAVKPSSADGTATAGLWESRTPPGYYLKKQRARKTQVPGLFVLS